MTTVVLEYKQIQTPITMKNLIALCILLFTSMMLAQKPDSPYLLVNVENAQIPLKASKADVQISGTVAHVTLAQTYHNTGSRPIEATYVFPLSINAAVHKMTMKIGDRTTLAKIFEKQEAERVYNKAVSEGKRAAKLDQDRPNVFKMSVGNIMPGDVVTIDISYTELLVPTNGVYQFVAPGVVGPRFTGESATNDETLAMPYTSKGIADTFDFDINVHINAGVVIKNVNSRSHQVNVNYTNTKTADVFLSKTNSNPSNRDFILDYNLRGEAIQSGVLMYEHEDENYFALMMEPTEKVKYDEIPAREYYFIVDVSGSMNGYPLEVSKVLMRNLLCDLRVTDTFNVQLFASSSTVYNRTSVPATTENIESAIRFLSEGQGGGGTYLLNALQTAYDMPRPEEGTARSMVVITDGYVSVEKEAFNLIEEHLDQGNVFTFGIGSSVNRYLIEGMAKVSNSEAFIATSMEEASIVAQDFKEYIATPLLTQVKLKPEGIDVYDLSMPTIPDVFASRPIVVYGKYKGTPSGNFVLTGYQGGKKFKQVYKVSKADVSSQNKALRYLWAREQIAQLDDYAGLFYENVKDKVVDLGLKYNLATKYTSFVAVDHEVVNPDGSMKTVKQPLPMPKNVNNTAVAVGAAGEIEAKKVFKNSFAVDVIADKTLTVSERRKVTMWTKAIYTKLLVKHQQT